MAKTLSAAILALLPLAGTAVRADTLSWSDGSEAQAVLRAAPEQDSPVVARLKTGTLLHVFRCAPGGQRCEVLGAFQRGWIRSSAIASDFDGRPVVSTDSPRNWSRSAGPSVALLAMAATPDDGARPAVGHRIRPVPEARRRKMPPPLDLRAVLRD